MTERVGVVVGGGGLTCVIAGVPPSRTSDWLARSLARRVRWELQQSRLVDNSARANTRNTRCIEKSTAASEADKAQK